MAGLATIIGASIAVTVGLTEIGGVAVVEVLEVRDESASGWTAGDSAGAVVGEACAETPVAETSSCDSKSEGAGRAGAVAEIDELVGV
jgi:hypothetical protein